MKINSVELRNFRNYSYINISFKNGLNFIIGRNAIGKTNLLEAIAACAIGKSFRNANNDDMIKWLCDDYFIKCEVENNHVVNLIEIYYKKNGKKFIKINGAEIKKINELFGYLNIVLFTPDDLRILKQGPSDRRRFMNMDLIQMYPDYYFNLLNYNKCLKQRNNILKNKLKTDMDIWDKQLIVYGTDIILRRQKYVDELAGEIINIHSKYFTKDESIILKYKSDIDINGNIKENYRNRLIKNRNIDFKYLTTTCGPQRDDIKFFINGRDASKFASQGQQKSLILSLKLTERQVFKKETGQCPVLLLDDVFSELDDERQKNLLKIINEEQSFITDIKKVADYDHVNYIIIDH